MEYERRFKFLICAPSFNDTDLDWLRLQQIVAEIERLGFSVLVARSTDDAELAIQTDAAIGCMVVDWGKRGMLSKPAGLISLVRRRGLEMPVLIMLRRKRLEDIPVEVLNHADGTIFLSEETPEFVARNLVSRLRNYAATLKTPFFGALVDYAEQGNQLWTCPGHNGGIFYSRSPIGRIFVEHLGPAIFRDDLDNSVLELGDLLTHEGPALAAEKAAARIFGAERTYFVLNGTSASNKIVLGALVAQGDLVLFDRNNHKAAHHGALLLGGGVPVYLPTDRNAYGMVGPIDYAALDETPHPRGAIRANPLVTDPEAWQRPRPFRVAVIEQCTYDGTIYDAQLILQSLGHLCDYILFDEAWAGFMKFHPLFRGRFAMGLTRLGGRAARHHRHPVHPQAARQLLPGVADPCPRRPHQGPGAPGRGAALQRELPGPRQHVAVLPDVRLARRRRAHDEGPLRRGAVGRHHPARHRAAQEAAHDPPRIRRRTRPTRRGAGSPTRSCRTPSPGSGRTTPAAHDSRGRTCRPTSSPANPAYLGAVAGQRRLARLPRRAAGLRHDRPEQADAADAGLRPGHRRI